MIGESELRTVFFSGRNNNKRILRPIFFSLPPPPSRATHEFDTASGKGTFFPSFFFPFPPKNPPRVGLRRTLGAFFFSFLLFFFSGWLPATSPALSPRPPQRLLGAIIMSFSFFLFFFRLSLPPSQKNTRHGFQNKPTFFFPSPPAVKIRGPIGRCWLQRVCFFPFSSSLPFRRKTQHSTANFFFFSFFLRVLACDAK